MNKKRIVLIDPVGGKAGMDFYDVSLLKCLADQGYETFLFSNFKTSEKDIKSFTTFNNIGVNKVVAIFNNFVYFIKALFYCRKQQINWLLLHFFSGGVFDLVTIGMARLLGLKIILIIHDVESLDSLVFPFTRKIILTRFNHSKIVHNQYSYDELAKLINQKYMGNVHIIPHGHYLSLPGNNIHEKPSLPEFTPESGVRYLLFFGQLKKAKGLDILIAALAKSKSDYQLIIAGNERDDSFLSYKNQIETSGLTGRIVPIIRYITNKERDILFHLSDAVVIPYKKVYQSGVLLLAMSYSKPVVASDLPSNLEVIKPGFNGFIFKSGNSAHLAETIDTLFFNPEVTKEIGYQGFKSIEKSHSWAQIGRFYAEILEA